MQMIKVPLKSTCPTSCACGSQIIRDWKHQACQTQAYINKEGDLTCDKGCVNVFIQNAGFKCGNSKTYNEFKSSSQFLMAFAYAMQSAEFNMTDQEQVDFVTSLSMKIVKKWNY